MHISDGEFVLARAYNRDISRAVGDANAIIAAKNRKLISLAAEVARLQSALEVETGKRKLAEYRLMRRN